VGKNTGAAIKGPAAITRSILNMLINKTQDTSDNILLSFSHSLNTSSTVPVTLQRLYNPLPPYWQNRGGGSVCVT
jgi:hypothetical protein